MAGANTKTFTDDNFEQEVLKSSVPVLVDFWAEWCMPCKMLAPHIDALADELGDKVKVGKVDTDANRDIGVRYGIQAIPTVIIFKDGQPVEKFVGLTDKGRLAQALAKAAG